MLAPVIPPFTGGLSTNGNTAGNTGLVSGRLVLAGGNNITLSGSTNASGSMTVTISGGAAGGFSAGVSNVGNTAGSTGVSGTRLVLVGSQNISLSQSTDANGATVSFSGGAGAAGNTGFISANATASLGTVNFSNSNNFTFGIAGQTLTASFAMLSAGVSTGGNTQGNTTVNSGTRLVFVGTSNITLSQATAAGATTISISGNAPQTTQPAINALGVSNTGNTAGNTGTSSGITWVIAGSNGITASESTAGGGPNTIWLSGATQTNQSAIKAFGVSNTGQTAGNTGVSTGIDWVLAGSDSITLSQSTVGGGPNTVWFKHPAWLTTADLSANSSNYVRNWKLTGNTSGTTSSAQGTDLWFSGGNSITVSGSSNSIVFSVGNYITTADLSQNSSKYVANWKLTGNTSGTTSSAQGTDLWFSGGNSITVSGSSNSIVFSVGNYLTTAALSGDTTKYVQNWKLTGNTSGTTSSAQGTDFWISGGPNITVSGSSNTIVISGATAAGASFSGGMSTQGNTSGDTGYATGRLNLVGSNNITLSGSTNGGSMSITISGANLQSAGMSTGGNTSGNSGLVTGQFVLAGGNNITLSGSTNAGSITLTVSGPNMMSAGMSTNGNTSGNTGFASNMLCLIGGNNITLSGSTNAGSMSLTISGGAGGAGLSAGMSTNGNTSGDTGLVTGRLVLIGGNNITLSGSTNAGSMSLTISAPNLGAGAMSIGVSTAGNTAGSTGVTGTRYVLVGTNAATLSQSTDANGGTVTISVPQTSSLSATGWVQISTNGSTISIGATTTANFYAVGNTSGTSSGTADIQTVSISAGSGVQVAASNSGWNIGLQQISQYDPWIAASLNTNSTLGQNSLYFVPFDVLWPISVSRLNVFVSLATTVTAANSTGRGGYTLSAALYSRMTSNSTDRISRMWSMTAGMSITMNSNTQIVATNLAGILNSGAVSTVGTSISSSNATTYPANSMGGFRVIPLPVSTNLTPGRYWFAIANSTTSSNAGACIINCSVMQQSLSNNIAFRPFGTSSAASDASFFGLRDGWGTYSLSSGGFPGSIPLTSDSIRGMVTGIIPYFNFSGYTNSSNAL